MPGLVKFVDGSTELVLRPQVASHVDRIFLTHLDLGYPEPRDNSTPRSGRSGANDHTVFHGARTVSLSLKVLGTDPADREALHDQLRALCAPRKRIYLQMLRPGWTSERRMLLRANPMSCPIDRSSAAYLRAELTFSCPSGLMESLTQTTTSVFLTASTAGFSFTPADFVASPAVTGFSFTPADFVASPAVAGMSFTPGNSGNNTYVANSGTVESLPVLRIYGNATNPSVYNKTTDKGIYFTGLTVPPGSYLEVDIANRTAYLNSNSSSSYYGYIDWTRSSWWALEPGLNELSFDAISADASTQLFIDHVSVWI